MNFCISHIFWEGNHCAGKLASLGLTLTDFSWWNIAPMIIKKYLTTSIFRFLEFVNFVEGLVWSPSLYSTFLFYNIYEKFIIIFLKKKNLEIILLKKVIFITLN
jgi:hypothetical protein